MGHEDVNRLRQISALSSLQDDDLHHLLSRLQTRIVRSGEQVCAQGDTDCSLLIVVAGRLRVVRKDASNHERVVGEVPAGEIFGEIALITGECRSASAYAMRDTVLWVLEEADYCRLLANHPDMARTVTRVAVQRLRESGSGSVRAPRCQAIAIATAPMTEVSAGFIRDLTARLNADRSVTVIDASIFPQASPIDRSESNAIEIERIMALDQIERSSNVVAYIANAEESDWSRRCLRQADRILVVVDAHSSQPSDLKPWQSRLEDSTAELVVIKDSRLPLGDMGALWAASKSGRAVHFVDLSQEEDWSTLHGTLVESVAAPDWLRGSPLFSSLSETDLRLILSEMETISLSARQVLFERGSASDGLYFIVNGKLQATIPMPTGQMKVVGTMGRGEVIGEISVLTEEPRSATVTALRDSTVAKLPLITWKRLAASKPAWSISLAQVVVDRLSGKRRLETGKSVCFAVQPLRKQPGLAEFVRGLEEALRQFGRCSTIDAAAVDRRFGNGAAKRRRGDSGEAMIVEWLSQQELASEALVLVCDEGESEWTQRCVRQADQILLVSSADSDASLTPLEASISDPTSPVSQTPRQLVLVHPAGASSAPGTLRWLEARTSTPHHHVRRGNASDMGRLVRLLTGRSFGLALSGGGSRGVAHVGIVRALREAGIPIDAVYGASAGAAIAGLIAMEQSIPVMIEKVTYMLTRATGHILSMGPPLVSLMSGAHPMMLLKNMFDDALLEDQFVPCGIVTADLVTGEQYVFERGLICDAARASSSLPGAWPPVIENGRIHVDGGVVNNLPIDLAQKTCRNGKVIAVDIAGDDDYSKLKPYGMQLSGWRLLWKNIFAPKENANLPAMMATISRCCTLTSANRLKSLKSDSQMLLLRPPVTTYGMFEIRTEATVQEVEAKSYEYARDAIKAWTSPGG